MEKPTSLYGKILLTKTMLLSLFSYVLQGLALHQHVLSQVNSMIYTLLREKNTTTKGPKNKIKRSAVCSVYPSTKEDYK